MPNLKYIPICGAILAAISLSAAVSVWYGHKGGVVSLVVTPRQFIPVAPGCTTGFAAVAWFGDGSQTDATAEASWQCSPDIGTLAANTLSTTNAQPVFGWVEASYSGLTTRVYIKVTSDGFWSSNADLDNDGVPDWEELPSNSPPNHVGHLNIRCRIN